MSWLRTLFGGADERREDRQESYGLVAIWAVVLLGLLGAAFASQVWGEGANVGVYLLLAVGAGLLLLQSVMQMFISLTIGMRGFLWLIALAIVVFLALQGARFLTGSLP